MSNRALFGVLLVLAGAAIILNSFFHFFNNFVSWWPLLIILIGLIQLVKRSASPLSSLIVIAAGLTFLARSLDLIPRGVVFPILLILAGCWFIFSRVFGKHRQVNIDHISHFTLFSGLETINQSQNFTGGSVAAVFGGSEIDLREAMLSKEGAFLELTAVFGGIEIIVPRSWQVQLNGTPLFGGLENKTSYVSDNRDDAPVLKVNSTVIFGGITVKN